MNIAEQIALSVINLFNRQTTQSQAVATDGLVDAHTLDAIQREWDSNWATDSQRRTRYLDFDAMDTGDIAMVLEHLVSQSLDFEESTEDGTDILQEARCFKVALPSYGKRGAKEVITQVLQDTAIRDHLPEICRDMLKYGDEFVELLWTQDSITGIQPHNVNEMYANRDAKGRIVLGRDKDGNPTAYQQRNDAGKVIAGWDPYAMVHLKLFPTLKKSYSRAGVLDGIRADWKKLTWLEQGMVLARTTRAYPRIIWQRDMTGKTTQDAATAMRGFIQAITTKNTMGGQKTKAPMTPDEDYFISSGYTTGPDNKLYEKRDNISLVDPSINGLGNITDIKYIRQKMFTLVPATVVGVSDNSQTDMTPQDIAEAKFISTRVQRALEVALRTMIDRALWAKGFDPRKINYRIIWPRTTVHTDWRYADGSFRMSMRDQNYLAMGVISRKTIRQREFGMTDDESDAEEAQIETELKSMATMYPTNSGQGAGEGSGNLGAAAENPQGTAPKAGAAQNPKANAQQAKSRTAGQNSTPKNQATSVQRKKAQEAIRRIQAEQLGLINLFQTPIVKDSTE